MKISEKIALATNPNTLVLHKEGLFYKAYNQNAMYFVMNIKSYKVSVKYIKSINQLVYSIGFPSDALHNNVSLLQKKINVALSEDNSTNTITFFAQHELTKITDYKNWMQQNTKDEMQNKPKDCIIFNDLVESIKTFELINSTPMEAMNFVQKLQSKISYYNE